MPRRKPLRCRAISRESRFRFAVPAPRIPACPPSPSTASTATPNSPTSCTRLRASIRSSSPIEAIGKSHEGRDIWVATVTNTKTGPAADKPAFWVDGNIHATEVAASAANLYFLHTLVTQYGQDADVTRALDTRAFYICPRINPDGAEWALADKPKWIRSSTRPYPHGEEDIEGLTVEDIDGDGRILQMRIADANGVWKAHPEEPRLMIRREPAETGGTYYRIVPEGTVEGYDGFTLRVKKPVQGLDLNRNFPASWRQEFEQLGAGPYPVSEPEIRAVVDFVTRHPNITGGTTFHTWSGVLLRPFEHQPDEEMHAEDLWVYQATGRKGTELTGYPHISVYHEFRYHPKSVIGGTFDWAVRAPGHLQLGGRDLVADARSRHHRLQVHRLVSRPCAGGRPQGAALERRQARRSRAHSVEAVRSPAARKSRDRRLEPLSRVFQSAAAIARARIAALSEVARLAGADLAEARAGACGSDARLPAATTRSCWSCRTPAGCRRTCRSARWNARPCAG